MERKGINRYRRASISIIRSRDYIKLGFRKNMQLVTKEKIFLADGKENKELGLLHLSVEMGRTVTVQKMHVSHTLYRSMILSRPFFKVIMHR